MTLIEASNVMDDVVVVAFGTQKKESLVGAVQVVRPSTLKVTSSNLSTSFAGKIAGVISTQSSGEPGADGANFWIRGISTFGANKSPLLILDGVETVSYTHLLAVGHLHRDDRRAVVRELHFGSRVVAQRVANDCLALRGHAPDVLFDLYH